MLGEDNEETNLNDHGGMIEGLQVISHSLFKRLHCNEIKQHLTVSRTYKHKLEENERELEIRGMVEEKQHNSEEKSLEEK